MAGIWYKHSMNKQDANGVTDEHITTKKVIYTFWGCFSLFGTDVSAPIPFGPCLYQTLEAFGGMSYMAMDSHDDRQDFKVKRGYVYNTRAVNQAM